MPRQETGLLWDSWNGPEGEIRVLRSALHRMAKWVLSGDPLPSYVYEREEQEIVDHFVATARMAGDADIPIPGERSGEMTKAELEQALDEARALARFFLKEMDAEDEEWLEVHLADCPWLKEGERPD